MPNDLQFAKELALDAGKIMREHFGIGSIREWKEDHSPVTITDKTINDLVIARVKEVYPTYGVLAEEGSHHVENAEYLWVCDPIDGTVPFSAAIPISTFSLALVKNGQPILGVVYDPFSERLFVAEKGKGATLNDQPITVSQHSELAGAYIDIESRAFMPVFSDLYGAHAKGTKLHCVTCPGVLIACGEFHGVLAPKIKAWDIAALKVVIEEAGGKVTDVRGNEQRFDQEKLDGVIMSNGVLHPQFIELVAPYL